MPIALSSGSGIIGSTDKIYILNSYIHHTNKEERHKMKEMKIKVIKRDAIKEPVKTVTKSKRASAREVVSNVTNWVNDLQAQKATKQRSR